MTYVNCHREDCTHFCGRKSSLKKCGNNPIDLSILGNPAPLKFEEDRDENIEEYGVHLLKLLRSNPPLVAALRLIPDDAKLGCFCYPKNCHCRIIIQACEFLKHSDV